GAGRTLVVRARPAGPGAEVLRVVGREARDRGGVTGLAVDVEVRDPRAAVAGGLVEEVVAVPLVGLRRAVVLDDRAAPVIALEVEALRRGERHARGLLGEELDDAEFGDVLLALGVLDAERVGLGVRNGRA